MQQEEEPKSGKEKLLWINLLERFSSNLRSNSFAHTILSVVRRITASDDRMWPVGEKKRKKRH